MSAIHGILEREGLLHGLRVTGVRGARRIVRSANAAVLGWRAASLPLGSTVIGARRIEVGPGFDAAQPVWLEAVTSFAGVEHDPRIRIGKNLSTSGRLHVSAIERIDIGDDCLFGTNVYIGDHSHGTLTGSAPSSPESAPRRRELFSRGPVLIGHRVWLGDNVVVVDGVSIGDGCVVGANSVVTRDLAPGTVAVGSPARAVKRYDATAGSWLPIARTTNNA